MSCRNWRVTGVRLGCAVNDVTCPRLQGSLPAALGNLSELFVLDVQVQIVSWLEYLYVHPEWCILRS